MKSTLISLAALASLASAQQIDIDAIQEAPLPTITVAPVGQAGQSTVAFNTAAAATSISEDVQPTEAPSSGEKVKRQACSPQGSGSFPQVQPDTDTNFQNYPYFHSIANGQAPPPPYIERFRDLNGSTSQNSYLTYFVLNSYDVRQCASYCNSNNLCTSFNIYAERDPSVDPAPACPNPPSITVYKCALWGSSISRASATNTGQYRQNFHVVIAASNGYDKTPFVAAPAVSGFEPALNLSTKAISQAGSNFLGSEFFAGPYDPQLCGYYATAQTSVNRANAVAQGLHTYQPANMFNSYTVYKSGIAWGTYCGLYNQNFDASYATVSGVQSGLFYYSVANSWTYILSPQDAGTC